MPSLGLKICNIYFSKHTTHILDIFDSKISSDVKISSLFQTSIVWGWKVFELTHRSLTLLKSFWWKCLNFVLTKGTDYLSKGKECAPMRTNTSWNTAELPSFGHSIVQTTFPRPIYNISLRIKTGKQLSVSLIGRHDRTAFVRQWLQFNRQRHIVVSLAILLPTLL